MEKLVASQTLLPDSRSQAPRVYSYTRFSTPEQAAGDSRRRQNDAAARWIDTKNAARLADRLAPVVLDSTLSLSDLGVSAYRGSNTAQDRALGGFLFACSEGLIAAGSYLLVESLDRVSRQSPRRVVPLLNDIVDAGVTLVTLNDGREYDAASLEADPIALMIALMVALRAHEESKVKGQRVAAAWAEKRRRVREGIDPMLTRRGPGWLEWAGDCWREREPHADTVRRIYRMALEGTGEHKIAAALNAEGVPVMGRGTMWHRSSVAKLLANPAAIGTLTPGRMDYGTGRRVRQLEEGIAGAYPAAVSEGDWLAVRAMKDGNTPAVRGRGAARPLTNLFAGLARCPDCGAAMTRVYKGGGAKGGKPKLVCTRSKVGAAKHYRGVPLDVLQEAFEREWTALLADIPAGEAGGSLDEEHSNLSGVIDATEDSLEGLLDLATRHPSPTIGSRIRALEAQLVSLRADLSALADRRDMADHGLVAARVGTLQDAMGAGEAEPGTLDIPRVNAALRALFARVIVDDHEGVLKLQWRQGGETRLRFRFPAMTD